MHAEPVIVPLARRPDAIPTLARWLFEEWGYYHERDSVERRIGELSGRLVEDRIPLTFAAFDSDAPGSEVIGTAALTPDDMDNRPDLTPWLASVLVAPTARGRGVGSALVKAVMHKAAELSVTRLYLYTENQQGLYSRLGWERLEECEYCGHQVTIMQIDLPAAADRADAD